MSVLKSLRENQFPILVSLPRNDMDLANAAFDAGADGIKVHLNAHHRASGNTFGNFATEKKFLTSLSKIPTGRAVMIGQETIPTLPELNELARMGYEFFNLYLRHAKPYVFESKLKAMLALDHHFSEKDIVELSQVPCAAIEASIVDPADYGKPLNETDLANYKKIVDWSQLPVVVPSQKKIELKDLEKLKEAGVHGLLIGVIVTGDTDESIFRTTRDFVERRNELWG